MWTTKKSLKKQICELEEHISRLEYVLEEERRKWQEELEYLKHDYPLSIGQVVYDVQLRNNKGRYTKTRGSKEHSTINEVIVTEKNYFNLVDRYYVKDVFLTRDAAINHLNSVCVE